MVSEIIRVLRKAGGQAPSALLDIALARGSLPEAETRVGHRQSGESGFPRPAHPALNEAIVLADLIRRQPETIDIPSPPIGVPAAEWRVFRAYLLKPPSRGGQAARLASLGSSSTRPIDIRDRLASPLRAGIGPLVRSSQRSDHSYRRTWHPGRSRYRARYCFSRMTAASLGNMRFPKESRHGVVIQRAYWPGLWLSGSWSLSTSKLPNPWHARRGSH